MKKIATILLVLSAFAFCANVDQVTEHCYDKDAYKNIPEGSCDWAGYVCKLGFNTDAPFGIMYFYLGTDASCTTLRKSGKFKTKVSGETESPATGFFVYEDDDKATALTMTLAGSLALSAHNRGTPVYIIYEQVNEDSFGGIRVRSIELFEP